MLKSAVYFAIAAAHLAILLRPGMRHRLEYWIVILYISLAGLNASDHPFLDVGV